MVASLDAISFPLSRTLQFRDANIEVATLVNPPTDFDGVVTDPTGGVRALWSSFATEGARDTVQVNRGMPAELVVEAVNTVRSARTLRSLEAEMEPLPLSAARKLGLPEEWIDKIDQHNPGPAAGAVDRAHRGRLAGCGDAPGGRSAARRSTTPS